MKDINVKEIINETKKLNLLYIEDNEPARNSTVLMLEEFFNYIDTATNGKDGVNKYKTYYEQNNQYYDLIITDINMPYMNGIDMADEMLKINPNQHIIVVTAFNEQSTTKQLIELGITNYLPKPISYESLLTTLNNTIKQYKKDTDYLLGIEKIKQLNNELDAIVKNFDTYVIASRTDLKGIITYVSKEYEKISGYTKEELIGQPHNIVRHPDMPKRLFKDMWDTISSGNLWTGEIKNLKKDGGFYWVRASVAPYYDNANNHIGYSSIRVDITAHKKVEKLSQSLQDLLNNTDQGFLSFNEYFLCNANYSKECLNIFETDEIASKNIADLLFPVNKDDKQLFVDGISNILSQDDPLTKELLLSLLPKEQVIGSKIINIKYKVINTFTVMLILTDITAQKELEEKIEQQHKIQKMIVQVASNKDEFIKLKTDFEKFLNNLPADIIQIARDLHTFKGMFSQKEMLYIVSAIHKAETIINENKEKLTNSKQIDFVLKKLDLLSILEKDLKIIKYSLGDNFLDTAQLVNIEHIELEYIEDKLLNLLNNKPHYKDDLVEIMQDMVYLTHDRLYDILYQYSSTVEKLAKKLNKKLNPLIIEGDKNILIPKNLKNFTNSLIHLFNNCIDHGIEEPDIRESNNKAINGTIKCSYEQISNILILKISDDGAGIDLSKIMQKAIEQGVYSEETCEHLSEEELLNLIFMDSFSTKDNTTIISGRGIGMNVIKDELDKINGKVTIENHINQGVTFVFTLPLKSINLEKPKKVETDTSKILGSIIKETYKFLQDNTDINIVGQKEVTQCSTYDYISNIKLKNGFNADIIYCFDNKLIKEIANTFIPSGFSDDEVAEMMFELPHEIANTTIGLAISDFPKHLGAIDISPPLHLNQAQVEEKIKQSVSTTIVKIDTSHGVIYCAIIKS